MQVVCTPIGIGGWTNLLKDALDPPLVCRPPHFDEASAALSCGTAQMVAPSDIEVTLEVAKVVSCKLGDGESPV